MTVGAAGAATAPPAPWAYRVVRALLRPLVLLALRPTVEGVGHVPTTGPAILCANHLSNIDPLLVGVVLRRPIVYLGKREYFAGLTGRLFRAVGVVPVAREGGSAAQAALDRGVEVLAGGAVLGIYPEGTRSPDGRLFRGRTGPIRLAARSGAPLVPVGIIGTRAVLPPHARLPRPHRVAVRFGRPLWVDGSIEDVDLRAHADLLMRRIAELTGQVVADRYALPGRDAPGEGAASASP